MASMCLALLCLDCCCCLGTFSISKDNNPANGSFHRCRIDKLMRCAWIIWLNCTRNDLHVIYISIDGCRDSKIGCTFKMDRISTVIIISHWRIINETFAIYDSAVDPPTSIGKWNRLAKQSIDRSTDQALAVRQARCHFLTDSLAVRENYRHKQTPSFQIDKKVLAFGSQNGLLCICAR